MSIQIIAIENKPISSITYIIYLEKNSNCIIVDPGSESPDEIDEILIDRKLKPIYIIFTHEHFDHIWSANYFIIKYDTTIVCSEYCAKAIKDPKLNLSIFYDPYKAIYIQPNNLITVKDGDSIEFFENTLIIKEAQGHSLGGILIILNKFIFTGDTIIKNIKTVTKLKNASKNKLEESVAFFKRLIGYNYILLPGHGESIVLDKYDLSIALN